MDATFDKSRVIWRGNRIATKRGRFREFQPTLEVEAYGEPGSEDAEIILTVDLLHLEDRKKSRPLCFSHLTPGQAIRLIAQLAIATAKTMGKTVPATYVLREAEKRILDEQDMATTSSRRA